MGRDTFWDQLTPPSPSQFLQERDRGSQDHFARRYLQICGANNHPHPPFNSLSPSWAALRKALERYPLKKPAPRCPPDSCPAPPPGSAHPSPGRLAVFPEQNPVSGSWRLFPTSPSDPLCGSPQGDPAQEAKKPGGLPPNLRSPRARLPSPPSVSVLSSSSSPCASRASSAQHLFGSNRGNFFLG